MNLSEPEFEDVTPAYFMTRLTGLRRQQEQAERLQWERTRWLACLLLQPHSKGNLTPQKLVTFPWEKPDRVKMLEWIEQNRHIYDKLTPN